MSIEAIRRMVEEESAKRKEQFTVESQNARTLASELDRLCQQIIAENRTAVEQLNAQVEQTLTTLRDEATDRAVRFQKLAADIEAGEHDGS